MGEAYFYHLTRRPMDETLSVLLEKSLGAGWRVAVRGQEPGRIDWLDQKLWLGPEDGFLPHGQAGGPHDGLQPILLTYGPDLPNDPQCLMSVDGAVISAEEVEAMTRVCVLFDGHDSEAVHIAREQWRTLTGAGCKAKYWSEESGRWEMKAES
ncbi:DNA polymerase III subunit chi [Pacificoceanicola onchidii]|uniref:DNA polymerase III subunit chi n=1 Tax=Pacificoceanicola onchidii TaxID=2562685 RepID=UPI0010A3BF03|nr:DNA polymerase III subunit chi [Pacificoceanicola onchidii]